MIRAETLSHLSPVQAVWQAGVTQPFRAEFRDPQSEIRILK